MELVALQQSHAAHDACQLRGQVPQTVMTGQTADASQLFELKWCKWVKFFESATSFPNDKMSLGRCLGPLIDVGPTMTAKILKSNGNTIHVSACRALTNEEQSSELEEENRKAFTDAIHKRLGPEASINDL